MNRKNDIVEIGRWWRDTPAVEIDAVALAGRRREAVLVGEAKWTRRVDARRELRALAVKAEALPRRATELRYAICAREAVGPRGGRAGRYGGGRVWVGDRSPLKRFRGNV